jgi:hypothetical protein
VAVCGWVSYLGGGHNGQILWSSADADGVIVRRDSIPYEAYRIQPTAADADAASALPVAVYTGLMD